MWLAVKCRPKDEVVPQRQGNRTGIVGAFFTLVVAIFNSLWPAIALHAVVDLAAGTMAWLALREDE